LDFTSGQMSTLLGHSHPEIGCGNAGRTFAESRHAEDVLAELKRHSHRGLSRALAWQGAFLINELRPVLKALFEWGQRHTKYRAVTT
jgi:hypothetical protein